VRESTSRSRSASRGAGRNAPLRESLADPGVAVVGGPLVRPDGETLEAAGLGIAPNTATFGLLEGRPRAAAGREPVDVAAVSGALMMVRRSDFLALGGFYEPIWMYGKEADARPVAWCSTRGARSGTSRATPQGRCARRQGSTGRRANDS
jgi:hypothetical protein